MSAARGAWLQVDPPWPSARVAPASLSLRGYGRSSWAAGRLMNSLAPIITRRIMSGKKEARHPPGPADDREPVGTVEM